MVVVAFTLAVVGGVVVLSVEFVRVVVEVVVVMVVVVVVVVVAVHEPM